MDIRLRRPDLSLEQKHLRPTVSFGVGGEFVNANEVGAILQGSFSPASLTSPSTA